MPHDPEPPMEHFDASDDSLAERQTEPRVASLDEVIGLEEIKAELRSQIQLWAEPERLERLGGKPRVGFIFSGPPGTGKTTSAHALASETGRDLYTFSGPEFYGDPGRLELRSILAELAGRPAIVFVDEADDLLHARNFEQEFSQSLVKHLLVGLDRTTRDHAAFFIFATNMPPSAIEPALCHAGRLGRPIVFRNLNLAERTLLLEHLGTRFAIDPAVRLSNLAARVHEFPTADLAHLLNEAAYVAWRNDRPQIAANDIDEAISRLRSGLPRVSPMAEDDLRRTAVHEAGHALVRLVTQGRWESVGLVQLSARSEGELGITESDEFAGDTLTPTQVRDLLAEALAGREAEILLLGDAGNGSINDLKNANGLADRAAADWGFSSRGARTYYGGQFPGSVIEARLDEAASEILADGQDRARELVADHRSQLELLSDRLCEHHYADATMLREWLGEQLPELT
ncbi:MAG: AAA family ATPase [Candidatus Limnocylindria bacterium]